MMSIEEAKNEKKRVEAEISALLLDFENKTGLTPESVGFTRRSQSLITGEEMDVRFFTELIVRL